jgi:predicted nuclease of predicted toxin-antitoxin system
MRILADENFPKEAIEALRARGHDVGWVREDSPGTADEEVIGRAANEGRLLITFDKDFGYLAFRAGLAGEAGIILFRTSDRSPSKLAARATAVLESRTDWAGRFSVVEDDRLRMSSLPGRR